MNFRIRDILAAAVETMAFFGAMIALYYGFAFYAALNAPIAQ